MKLLLDIPSILLKQYNNMIICCIVILSSCCSTALADSKPLTPPKDEATYESKFIPALEKLCSGDLNHEKAVAILLTADLIIGCADEYAPTVIAKAFTNEKNMPFFSPALEKITPKQKKNALQILEAGLALMEKPTDQSKKLHKIVLDLLRAMKDSY